jgi:hypothetical protein
LGITEFQDTDPIITPAKQKRERENPCFAPLVDSQLCICRLCLLEKTLQTCCRKERGKADLFVTGFVLFFVFLVFLIVVVAFVIKPKQLLRMGDVTALFA